VTLPNDKATDPPGAALALTVWLAVSSVGA
jgi:hypothetical protein